jgi:hypothetical protein
MSLTVVCPACRYKLRVPSRLAGKRVTCPKCHQAVQAPEAPPPEPEEGAKPPPVDPNLPVPEMPLSLADRCGRAGLILGVVAFLVLFLGLCLGNIANWFSASLSGFGLFLSLSGLIGSFFKEIGRRLHRRPPEENVRRDLPVSYPIAGSFICTAVLVVAIYPWWVNAMKQPGSRGAEHAATKVGDLGRAATSTETRQIVSSSRSDLHSTHAGWQCSAGLRDGTSAGTADVGFSGCQRSGRRLGTPSQPSGPGLQRAVISIYAAFGIRPLVPAGFRVLYRGSQVSTRKATMPCDSMDYR